jgi:hypothetical protein
MQLEVSARSNLELRAKQRSMKIHPTGLSYFASKLRFVALD